jgi:hypothetical protein
MTKYSSRPSTQYNLHPNVGQNNESWVEKHIHIPLQRTASNRPSGGRRESTNQHVELAKTGPPEKKLAQNGETEPFYHHNNLGRPKMNNI